MMPNYVRNAVLVVCALSLIKNTTSNNVPPPSPALDIDRIAFATELFRVIAADRTQQNVVYSPWAIQTVLELVYLGAKGETATELRKGLKLGAGAREQNAQSFAEYYDHTLPRRANGPEMHAANRIYMNEKIKISPHVEPAVSKYINSLAEQISFSDTAAAASKINGLVEKKTQSQIQNIIAPNEVYPETSVMLVSALCLKAKWAKQFSLTDTVKSKFLISDFKAVSVDTMQVISFFSYGELPELDARAIDMPFENSNISMLVLVPNKVGGLEELERKLATLNLMDIVHKLGRDELEVHIPKFNIDFDINLNETLKTLGMATMLSDKADLSDLFEGPSPKISKAVHKANLVINEGGSEEIAKPIVNVVPKSMTTLLKVIRVNHPFLFAIHCKRIVYLAGHVADLS